MINELVDEDDNGYFNISKDDAINVASLAWGGAKVGRNLERGYKTCELSPLPLVKIKARLATFMRNEATRHVELAAWLQLKSVVEDDILKLPAPLRKNVAKKRKCISVGDRLLPHEVLQEMEVSKGSSGVNSAEGRSERKGLVTKETISLNLQCCSKEQKC
ncbi:hypothetical protein PR003_g1822 [Phytophthora rubi]|uniref:DDE-1 domain-containing protein n=1 Tax=Phytophthora rubi TaxID=129364 RepID=A0A6A3NUI5_9STRA|nr:hypothetical protein PR002_g1721 [Phytophthora rubi]KAE9357389.1 hypothetical protein PR003_g1822 [Phytophthora rubi]